MGDEGEASNETVFEHYQEGDLVWARYEGGAVRLGYLVGTRNGDLDRHSLQPAEQQR